MRFVVYYEKRFDFKLLYAGVRWWFFRPGRCVGIIYIGSQSIEKQRVNPIDLINYLLFFEN